MQQRVIPKRKINLNKVVLLLVIVVPTVNISSFEVHRPRESVRPRNISLTNNLVFLVIV